MEQKIREIRLSLDATFSMTGKLTPSREVASAKTSFEVSKMMLGKVLAELGTKNPYPESKNPDSPKIEPTAEKSQDMQFKEGSDHVFKVKTLRQDGDVISKQLEELLEESLSPKVRLFCENSFIECTKGVMWLGMELGRIRDLSEVESIKS